MTTKEKIAVLQAFDEGKAIQSGYKGGVWLECVPIWNFAHNDYRVKPPEPSRPREGYISVGWLKSEPCHDHKDCAGRWIKVREVL